MSPLDGLEPAFRVLRGLPTPAELAALTAVLTALPAARMAAAGDLADRRAPGPALAGWRASLAPAAPRWRGPAAWSVAPSRAVLRSAPRRVHQLRGTRAA